MEVNLTFSLCCLSFCFLAKPFLIAFLRCFFGHRLLFCGWFWAGKGLILPHRVSVQFPLSVSQVRVRLALPALAAGSRDSVSRVAVSIRPGFGRGRDSGRFETRDSAQSGERLPGKQRIGAAVQRNRPTQSQVWVRHLFNPFTSACPKSPKHNSRNQRIVEIRKKYNDGKRTAFHSHNSPADVTFIIFCQFFCCIVSMFFVTFFHFSRFSGVILDFFVVISPFFV